MDNKQQAGENQLYKVLSSIREGVTFSDSSGRFYVYNAAMEEITGYSMDEANESPDFISLLYPDPKNRKAALKGIEELKKKKSTREIETVIATKNGQLKNVLVSSSLIDYGGRDLFLSVYRDNTKYRMIENQLMENEWKVRAIFDETYQFIGLTTTDGTLIEANRSALEFSGVQASGVLGKPFWETPWWAHSPQLQGKVRQAVKSAAKGEFVRFEATHLDKDGQLHYVDFSLKPVKNASGKVVYLIPEGRDITERKQMEKNLQNAYVKLKETQAQLIQAEKMEAMGRLASGVAHEVRNPLEILLQGVNYLEEKIPPEEKKMFEIVQMMKNNIKRADKIVRSVLEFSRSGELSLGSEDINSVLESSLELVRYRINTSHIEIIRELSPGLPGILIDKNKIEQVFVNLLLNAIESMPEGGKLSLRSYRSRLKWPRRSAGKKLGDYLGFKNDAVVIEIEDTGCGIPEANKKKLFEPFFTTKTPKEGTGLGLSVSRNIIELHKGIIDIESIAGRGTKARVFLRRS
ncbi:MAG: PAS domain S-box protein [Candidatus Omnitrophica bacterium]|nr:PAS domain S-box protein [Candidatus Omnitrophota bacterium]